MFPTMVELSETIGRLTVSFHAQLIGSDWNVIISGGHLPHIGAVSLARPDTKCSTLCLPGHMEGELAEQIASTLANCANATVCVICGIHLEAITQEEILSVNLIADKFISEFMAII